MIIIKIIFMKMIMMKKIVIYIIIKKILKEFIVVVIVLLKSQKINKQNFTYNKYYSNKNLIIYKNDLNSKNKTINTEMNKYFKRETIDAKSISQIKEAKIDKLDNKKDII
jgi:hypothetical protein